MEVISTRRYEVRPPADSHASILVDPSNAVALVKEEEWETRKKKEITTTRQIETRVKRQVVLEDGEVVVDSGPQVTTNTTEDVEQQEHTTQERRTTGDEPQEVDWPQAAKAGALVQKELNETIVKSREEIEERLETEDRQQLGDITDEAYLQAVRNNRGDLRLSIAESKRQLANQAPHQGPRVVQHTTRSNKVVDTEKTLERSELKHDGQIVTERKTTVEHEETKDDEAPEEIDGVPRDEVDEAYEVRKEATQRYAKRRDEDIVDYVSNGERVAREMRYVSETTEAERTGDWPSDAMPGVAGSARVHGKHGFTTETQRNQNAATTPSAAAAAAAAARKDAIARKSLDLEEEDEARKFETSKWLESHFGSESRSSHGSLEDEEHRHRHQHSTNTSYINVTMKSVPTTTAREHYKQTTTTTTTTKQQRRTTTNGASSPSGYFQGISEWSERYQSTEKQNNHIRSKSPQYIVETTRDVNRSNGHHQPSPGSSGNQQYTRNNYEVSSSRRHHEQQQRHSPPHERPKVEPPSPPLRRKAKEQVTTTKTERSYHQESAPRAGSIERASSPVHVVQRTWESRSRDEREHLQERRERTRNGEVRSSSRRYHHHHHRSPERTRHRPRSPASRSVSPSPVRSSPARRDDREKHGRPSKSPSPSKYKIGESFRKLVGKLRSASSERKNGNGKRPGGSSTSQLTQTDDGSYVQYNSVDRNVPLGPEYDVDDRAPPERPPRSPRSNNVTSTSTTHVINVRESPKATRSSAKHRSGSGPRHHEYKETVVSSSTHQRNDQPIHRYYLGEDPYGGSIYGKEKGYRETRLHSSRHRGKPIDEVDYSMESSSLGRFSRSTGRLVNEQQAEYERARETQTLPRKMHNQTSSSSSRHVSTTSRRVGNGHASAAVTRYVSSTTNNNNHVNGHGTGNGHSDPSRQYGSMINISFRNQVSPPKTTHYVQTTINAQPPKPEKIYKSTLSRSKSFNVEIADDGVVKTPQTPRINKLNESAPLKSPGILASINRNNNREKLFTNGRLHDH